MKKFIIIGDVLSVLFAFIVSFYYALFISNIFFAKEFSITYNDIYNRLYTFSILSIGIIILFFKNNHYSSKNSSFWNQVKDICFLCGFGLLLDSALSYSTKSFISRFWVFNYWIFLCFFIIFFRELTKTILVKFGAWNIPAVFISEAKNLSNILSAMSSNNYINYNIKKIVLIDCNSKEIKKIHVPNNLGKVEITTNLKDGFAYLKKNKMFTIFSAQNLKKKNPQAVISFLTNNNIDYAIVKSANNLCLYDSDVKFYFGYNLMLIQPKNVLNSGFAKFAKRFIDIVGSIIGIIVFSPILIVLITVIWFNGKKVFFGHKRIGKNGKEFKCWKFRSMIINAEVILKEYLKENPEAKIEWRKNFKLKADPRITKFGRFLRSSSLDELPQLFNVLTGEMSLVGPRPIVKDEKKYYGNKLGYYLAMKPGLTGVWQVSGRSNTTYNQRVNFDIWYSNHWSIWNDCVIILKTIKMVLFKIGAF